MASHTYGPPAGSEGVCSGCGQVFTRGARGQAFCSPRCTVLHGPWRYPSLWASRGPKAGPREPSLRESR